MDGCNGPGNDCEDSDSLSLYQGTAYGVSGYSDFVAGLEDQTLIPDENDGLVSLLGSSPVSDCRRIPWAQQTEDSILNLDTSFSGSDCSSFGLSGHQIPERPHNLNPLAMTHSGSSPIHTRDVIYPSLSEAKSGTLSVSDDDRNQITEFPKIRPAKSHDEFQYGLAINQTPSAKDFSDDTGTVWNLFDEEDPWEAIGRLLSV